MLQTAKLIAQGQGLAQVLVKRAATVTLDWDLRQKSRFETTDSLGRSVGVFLPRGSVVRGGDVLVAEDGSLIRVQAAPQSVLRITACTAHGSPFDLTRAAYHLGNRHVPIELRPDYLQIEPDHVLAEMLRAMHLIVNPVDAPFEPESGAYSSHGGHTIHAGHAHPHVQAQSQTASKAEPHVHGPDCNHDHGHGHGHDHNRDHDHGNDHDHDHDHGNDHGHGHGHGPHAH
jgi:urease accessory protein